MNTTKHVIYVNKFSTGIEAFEEVAQNENLSKTDLRVFMFLCCRVGSTHLTKIDERKMADSLNIPYKKVKEAIDNLLNECIITRDSDDHVSGGYRMVYTDDLD